MEKRHRSFLLVSLCMAPAISVGTQDTHDANRELISAILAYGLTNKRSLFKQEAFDKAFEKSKYMLNSLTHVNPGPMTEDAVTMTPLMAAAYSLSYYMILKLIAAGADPHLQGSNGLDAYGWVRNRSWIARLFPQFQKELDAALSLKPETEAQKEFVATLTEVYRLLEPRLTQRWGGFYQKKAHAGIVEYLRTHHHTLMDRAALLLNKTRNHNADYTALLRSAQRLLKDVKKALARREGHPHIEKHL